MHNVPPFEALKATDYPCSKQALHGRIKRLKRRLGMMARYETVFVIDEAQMHAVELGDNFTLGGWTVKMQ